MSYGYDALNRPTAVTWTPAAAAAAPAAGSVTFGHAYNKANQRIGQTVTDNNWFNYPAATPSTVSYTANALNQYTAVGAVTPSYDGNGNLASDGTFAFGYDAENRLVSAVGAGNTAAYAYDAQGRRKTRTVNGTTTVFVTDADNREVLEYDGSSGTIQRWYAYGLGANDVVNRSNVVAGTRAALLPDIQGSVIASLDSGSGTLSKIGYLPYGKSASATAPFGYTAQPIDPETNGLYYYRARHYSPAWGRFLQSDPVGYAGGVNLYVYVANDPLNGIDPFGLDKASGSSGSSSLGFLGPVPAIAAEAGSAISGSAAAVIGALSGVFLLATTGPAGSQQDQVQYVVRGGLNTANNFINGSGVTIDALGNLQGVSVQTFPNTNVQQLSQRQFLPYNQIGVNTLAGVSAAGATMIPSPTLNNPYHATMGGISPETAQSLFTPTIPNPNPKLP